MQYANIPSGPVRACVLSVAVVEIWGDWFFFSIRERVNFYTRYHNISSYIMLLS